MTCPPHPITGAVCARREPHNLHHPEPVDPWTGIPDTEENPMPRYRKKPVVIEAMQLTDSNVRDVQAWSRGLFDGACPLVQWHYPDNATDPSDSVAWLVLTTIHGDAAIARPGDWVIPESGAPGRFYPCKPDIFAATYEPVTEDGAA